MESSQTLPGNMQKNQFKSEQFKIAIIAVGVIYTVLLIAWAVSAVMDYHKASVVLRKAQGKRVLLEKDLADFKTGIVRFKQEREKFEALLFKQKDIPTFLDEMAGFARNSKVNIMDLATRTLAKVAIPDDVTSGVSEMQRAKMMDQNDKEQSAIMYLPVQITVNGRFEGIVDFLNRLERYRLLTTLTDVAIEVKEYPKLQCSLTVNIYSLKDVMK